MSVILTATKRAVQKPKPKKKSGSASTSKHGANFDPTPPTSSETTTVWHWLLDGKSTTIMLNKEFGTVWCNGEEIETRCAFAGTDQAVIDFDLQVKAGAAHGARIRRISKGAGWKQHQYQLTVDNYSILEHTNLQPDIPTGDCYAPLVGDFDAIDLNNITGDFGAEVGPPPAYYADPDQEVEAGGVAVNPFTKLDKKMMAAGAAVDPYSNPYSKYKKKLK